MTTEYIDIHPHIISPDEARYPRVPLFGKQSDWSKERPVDIAGLVKAMDEVGVGKSAIVHASTCYGHDLSYVCNAVAAYPGRFTAVGSVDLLEPDATDMIRKWAMRGLTGLRLFTGGSTKAFDVSAMDDPRSFGAWHLAGDLGMPICVQTGPEGLIQVAGLAKRFPKTKIILDHLARPVLDDGAPYHRAASLWALAPFENVYLKLTPRATEALAKGEAEPESFYTRLVTTFGSGRIAWGSNFPANDGTMKGNLEAIRQATAFLPAHDRHMIFSGTAQTLYPALAD